MDEGEMYAQDQHDKMEALRARVAELEGRLEECRGVVRAALTYSSTDYFSQSLRALTSATRKWAEGKEG